MYSIAHVHFMINCCICCRLCGHRHSHSHSISSVHLYDLHTAGNRCWLVLLYVHRFIHSSLLIEFNFRLVSPNQQTTNYCFELECSVLCEWKKCVIFCAIFFFFFLVWFYYRFVEFFLIVKNHKSKTPIRSQSVNFINEIPFSLKYLYYVCFFFHGTEYQLSPGIPENILSQYHLPILFFCCRWKRIVFMKNAKNETHENRKSISNWIESITDTDTY